MKKKGYYFSLAVLGAACILLAGNAKIVSVFLNNVVKAEQIDPPLEDTNVTFVKADVPNLKTEPGISSATSNEYLATVMTHEEIDFIYQFVDNSKKEAFDETRNMTEEEIARNIILGDQYVYDGLRPKGILPLKAGDYDFYFDLDTETIHYPERELTDEELLQFIDWTSRINYALSLRYEPPKPSAKDIDEKEAIAIAHRSVEKLFDFDTTPLQVTASYSDMGPTQKGQWFVQFSPYKSRTLQANGETFWEYVVFIDSLTGDILDTTGRCSTYKRTYIDEKAREEILKDESWIEIAKSIIIDKQGETRKIKSASIDTKGGPFIKNGAVIDDTFNAERGTVNVLISLEDDSLYTVELLYPDQSLRCLTYTPKNLNETYLTYTPKNLNETYLTYTPENLNETSSTAIVDYTYTPNK